MNSNYMLNNETAKSLYQEAKAYPIYDYHCHLSAKEIYEDNVFSNIGEMWLAHDHYKWRLLRNYGVDESYITGDRSDKEKFMEYMNAISLAAGSPLYHWSQMELSQFFNIDYPLCAENAERIWNEANAFIESNQLSPKKLITRSNVAYIATTDDMADDLSFHQLTSNQPDFPVMVAPSFRTDKALLLNNNGYPDYIRALSDLSNITISDLSSLKQAILNRLDYFVEMGCKFSDVGIPMFPNCIYTEELANVAFCQAINGTPVTDEQLNGFIGNLYLFLGQEYKKRNMVMQLHLAVSRNINRSLFDACGGDCGIDCIGDTIDTKDVATLLDCIESTSGLAKTIIYTLNDSMTIKLASIAGSFRNVLMGAAWWFNDTKTGISNTIKAIAETGHLATFLGMLTDSRSFLSYARHDYFRRILCCIIGEWIETGEFSGDGNLLVKRICFENVKSEIESN